VRQSAIASHVAKDDFQAQAQPALNTLMRWIPTNINSIDDFLVSLESARANPEWIMFAVVDKTKPSELDLGGALAGEIALLHTSVPNRTTEIGLRCPSSMS
jgi:hypothetical protein